MLVVASTAPSATPYSAIDAMKTAWSGARAKTGTATAIPSSPTRRIAALSTRLHAVSASTEPSPASSTIIRSSRDSVVSLYPQWSCTVGSLVVRLMKTKPWVKKAPAAARR